ncbi:MAG: adventurous gliding motility lipoprotein CglC [Myxococcaceae bacterium]
MTSKMKMNRLLGAGIVLASLGLGAGCGPSSGLNKDCILVKKDPNDASKTAQITEADVQSNNNRDIISFGSTDCEDLVCVHEAGSPLTGNPAKELHGFCSKACLEGSTNSCPSDNPEDDKKPDTKFSCRSLLLDEQTLATLRQSDPESYKKFFGDTTSPFFCARDPKAPATSP